MTYCVGKFETKARILAMEPQDLLASFATMNSLIIYTFCNYLTKKRINFYSS